MHYMILTIFDFVIFPIIDYYFTKNISNLQVLSINCFPEGCRFVNDLGQRTGVEKAREGVSWANYWSGDCGQRAVFGSQSGKRRNGKNRNAFGPPGGCVRPCHCVWECRDESVCAEFPVLWQSVQKG